jgi:hypothetical protein
MKLSAEQFADLAASFTPTSGAGGAQEARRAARVELEAHASIRFLSDGRPSGPTAVQVFDFSTRGIAILRRAPMERGTQFVIDLPRQSGGCVSMLCTIMHCKEIRPDTFKIGAEFTCVVAEHPGSQPSQDALDKELKRIRESVLG